MQYWEQDRSRPPGRKLLENPKWAELRGPGLALALVPESAQVQRLHGTVARWHAKGGWGFITRDDGLGDAFVHQRSIQKNGYRSLLEGERVPRLIHLIFGLSHDFGGKPFGLVHYLVIKA